MVKTEELPAELSAPRAMPRQGQRRAALSIRLSAVIVSATIDEPRVLTVSIGHDPIEAAKLNRRSAAAFLRASRVIIFCR
jgi:hypothetical protein